MATPTSQEAGEGNDAETIIARRTESLDAPHILKLVQPWTECMFGRVNVVNIIEKAVLAITLCNKDEDIMGHAAFLDYPNLKDVDSAEWEKWYNSRYTPGQVNSLNTLFLHYFVAKKEYAMGCAQEIIRTAFNAVPDLHFLFLAVPVGEFPDPSLAQAFTPMETSEDGQADKFALFVCKRHEHVPVLHIRQAFVEDHDDLTPIFNRQSDMLRNTYGIYFLAELIEAQDSDMQCLVAEVEKTSYGFMSVSTNVNVDLLNECFELIPFNGLRKSHPSDVIQPPPTPPATPPDEAKDEPDKEAEKGRSSQDGSKVTTPLPSEGEGEAGGGEKTTLSEAPSESSPKGSKSGFLAGGDDEVKKEQCLSGTGSPALVSEPTDFMASVADTADALEKGNSFVHSVTPKELVLPTQKRFVPSYFGEANAFSIQLFCIAEQFEMRSCDFLSKAFSKFPDKDYCIITVPHMVPEFPLIQNFVRVTPKCPSVLPQELYIFHRSGLLKNFHVRPACTSDYVSVEKLVDTVHLKESILADLAQFNKARRDVDGTEIQAFVAECQNQVVGISIIRREEEIEYIRSHYNIEDFIYYNHHRREDHGHLHHFVLNPVFSYLTKHFFKEILRLGHKTCLHYPLYPPYTPKQTLENHSLVSGLSALVPVRSRRQIVYPKEKLGINGPSERVLKEFPAHALNHINRKLVLEPKVTINARIVVVGASDVGISYLETLVYCPHLRFNNVTLISPHGITGDFPPDELRDQVLTNSYCFTQDDYAKMALRTWVNVIYGKMTAINRAKKQVIVNGSSVVPYDHLVLCTGKQYQAPCPTMAAVENNANNDQLPQSPDKRYAGPVPRNLYLINDAYDAAVMLYRVENHLLKNNKKIVVYGRSMDCFTCLQALLTLGMPGEKLALVMPPIKDGVTCFNDPKVEHVVHENLKNAGIECHYDAYLANWNDGEMDNDNDICSVAFTTPSGCFRLECQAFFSFYNKEVDSDSFTAINCACLVYDGKLVINASFHTNDVSVRAAGPLTKFQRKYHCEPWSHANFNSKEVGIALASEMLRLFDPTLEPQTEPPEEPLNLIPIYRSPKIVTGVLPGEFRYMHVYKPCLAVPLSVQMAQSDYGHELVTGEPGGSPEYFRLHMNQYKSVETITCLAKKSFPMDNFQCLFGVHERMLNNLTSRFGEGLIKDFYSYLMEPWSMTVYHDRFADFRDEIRELLITNPKEGVATIEDLARQLVDEETGLSDEQRKEMMLAYVSTGAKRAVETRLLNFLSYNHYHLPMYAKPGMV